MWAGWFVRGGPDGTSVPHYYVRELGLSHECVLVTLTQGPPTRGKPLFFIIFGQYPYQCQSGPSARAPIGLSPGVSKTRNGMENGNGTE